MPIVLNGSGPVTGVTSLNTTVSDTEIGYLDGVTSALQTQIDGKLTTPGAWTSWTPTFTNLTVGNGTRTGSYVIMGKTVIARFSFTMGSTSSITGNLTLALPVSAATYSKQAIIGNMFIEDSGVAGYVGFVGSGGALYYVSSSLGGAGQVNSTVPFTWATNDFFAGTITYEAA